MNYMMECSFLCTTGHYTEGSETAKIHRWKKSKLKAGLYHRQPNSVKISFAVHLTTCSYYLQVFLNV